MITFRNILALILVAALAGCSTIKKLDRSDSYKAESDNGTNLAVPQDLSSQQMENFYQVPLATKKSMQDAETTLLPPGYVLPDNKAKGKK
jgi:uncharacterized lipoprotein